MVAAIGASMHPDGDIGGFDKSERPRFVKARRGYVKPPSGDEPLEAVEREYVRRYQCGGLGSPRLDPSPVGRHDGDRRGPFNHADSIMNPFCFAGGQVSITAIEIRHWPAAPFLNFGEVRAGTIS
jgi:hypothetical protein